jgi:hypothetical protein
MRDVDSLIADALQVAIDAGNGQEEAQVNSHGGLSRQEALNAIVYFDLHFIDRVFLAQNGFRQVFFRVQYGVDCLVHGALRKTAHPKQPLLEFLEIVFPMAFHVSSIRSECLILQLQPLANRQQKAGTIIRNDR